MKISDDLANIIGKDKTTRSVAFKLCWAYAKEHNLQDAQDGKWFIPDKKMAKVFGTDKLMAIQIPKFIADHLTSLN